MLMILVDNTEETSMNSKKITSIDSSLPVPGTVYAIPEGTHADLDIQDDKEEAFSYRSTMPWRSKFHRKG